MGTERELYDEDWRQPLKGAIVRSEVTPKLVQKMCPVCASSMKATGEVINTNPPVFSHVCSNCGFNGGYLEKYPYIDFEMGIRIS